MSGAPLFNVLHVFSDQHLATCMGVEGHPQAITPNMDRLAASGVRFTRAYTQNPICTPSRMSVLTGQYCHNHGYYGLSGPRPERLPSFLGHFREHGYRTAAIGKLHVPSDPVNWLEPHVDLLDDCYYPHRQDLDKDDTPYYNYLRELGLRDKEDSVALRDGDTVRSQHLEGRPSAIPFKHSVEGWCVREAIRFIDGTLAGPATKPFCIQVSLPRPHQCFTPDRRFWDMYPEGLDLPETFRQDNSGRPPHFRASAENMKHIDWTFDPRDDEEGPRRLWRGYLGAVTHVDHALGLLMDALDERGIAEETIVVYHADHGSYSGTFGVPEKAPGICSEAVCRVPYIWRVPGVSPRVRDDLVESIDLAPTILSLCGLPAMGCVDGCDLSGALRGEDVSGREIAVTENPWSKSLRWGRWRFVHYQPEMFSDQGEPDVGELYDMEADPSETTNLHHDPASRDVVNDCRRLLLEWLIRTQRNVTAWPPLDWPETSYNLAEDGKEANGGDIEARRKAGHLSYI